MQIMCSCPRLQPSRTSAPLRRRSAHTFSRTSTQPVWLCTQTTTPLNDLSAALDGLGATTANRIILKVLRRRLATTTANRIILKVLRRRLATPPYCIQPSAQQKVAAAVFQIVEENGAKVGMGVFYSPTEAVTCAHSFTSTHGTLGSMVTIVLGEERIDVKVKERDDHCDIVVLESSSARPYIPMWNGNHNELRGYELVLASRICLDVFQGEFGDQLALFTVVCTTVSRPKTHLTYTRPALKVDSGAALVIATGDEVSLVGIHQKSTRAVALSCENIDGGQKLDVKS